MIKDHQMRTILWFPLTCYRFVVLTIGHQSKRNKRESLNVSIYFHKGVAEKWNWVVSSKYESRFIFCFNTKDSLAFSSNSKISTIDSSKAARNTWFLRVNVVIPADLYAPIFRFVKKFEQIDAIMFTFQHCRIFQLFDCH